MSATSVVRFCVVNFIVHFVSATLVVHFCVSNFSGAFLCQQLQLGISCVSNLSRAILCPLPGHFCVSDFSGTFCFSNFSWAFLVSATSVGQFWVRYLCKCVSATSVVKFCVSNFMLRFWCQQLQLFLIVSATSVVQFGFQPLQMGERRTFAIKLKAATGRPSSVGRAATWRPSSAGGDNIMFTAHFAEDTNHAHSSIWLHWYTQFEVIFCVQVVTLAVIWLSVLSILFTLAILWQSNHTILNFRITYASRCNFMSRVLSDSIAGGWVRD